ncbi:MULTISPECIES: glycosyltransferase [Rhodanobacter]|uniref:glycosyltransferase n=1 Tax=Rhodanobacter TaxID=75309 RepID=UPI0004017211|nr:MULTISPECIES: glycosyltransferase [Rhodanobacter]UJJ55645.1 glycosyltransferase [Rhodanobacter thiooxydans]
MKILWCHEVSYLDKPVYEYQDFPERLAARGHDVEVIDFSESGEGIANRMPVSRTGEGTVMLTTIPHDNRPGLKYIQARGQFRRMLIERLRRGDIDAVFVYSIFINGTQTVRLSRKFGVPVVYRVLDAYHRLRPGFLAQTILRLGERFIYRRADRVLVTNEQMGQYVSQIAGTDVSARTVVVDHGVDSIHFAPRSPDPELMLRYDLSGHDTIALFLGTTYAFSGLANLVRRMPTALQQCSSLKLVIVGGGEQDQELASLVEALGLKGRVVLTGMVPYQEVPRYLSLATLALNPFELNDITRDIIPIKILQYQAAALPVLSTPLPDLLRKHSAGTSGVEYSDSDNPDVFVSRMAELLRDTDHLRSIGRRGLDFVTEHFSVDRAVDHIETTFKQIRERVA